MVSGGEHRISATPSARPPAALRGRTEDMRALLPGGKPKRAQFSQNLSLGNLKVIEGATVDLTPCRTKRVEHCKAAFDDKRTRHLQR